MSFLTAQVHGIMELPAAGVLVSHSRSRCRHYHCRRSYADRADGRQTCDGEYHHNQDRVAGGYTPSGKTDHSLAPAMPVAAVVVAMARVAGEVEVSSQCR